MVARKLIVTFAGHRVSEEGLPVDGLVAALSGVQDALKLMVGHLGGHQQGQGQPPKWVREQSRLMLTETRRGSLVAELDLPESQASSSEFSKLGPLALDALMDWDGSTKSSLPDSVVSRLSGIPRSLPEGVDLWLGDNNVPRRVKLNRQALQRALPSPEEPALLYGRLNAIDWNRGTAQLHVYRKRNVQLRFDSVLHDQMLDCATRFVEVRGKGRFNSKDQWQYVQVERLRKVESGGEPFDLEAFLSNPNPKIFDPDKVIQASEPFDVNEFIDFIRSSREDRRG